MNCTEIFPKDLGPSRYQKEPATDGNGNEIFQMENPEFLAAARRNCGFSR